MHNPLTSRRSVMHGGMLLVSGPAAVVLCITGALAGAWQPALMRPRAFQPHRPAELLLGRDDCPGCESMEFNDCQQPNDYRCNLCEHLKYTIPPFQCDKSFNHYSGATYSKCISQKYPNMVCYHDSVKTCWTTWDCNTSKVYQNTRCDDADPPKCTVMNASNYYCRHCSKADNWSAHEQRNHQYCIPCDPGDGS